jgi:hypothetical protein
MRLLKFDPRRWLLMAVVVPVTGRVLVWLAGKLRTSRGPSRSADWLENLGRALRRDRRRGLRRFIGLGRR